MTDFSMNMTPHPLTGDIEILNELDSIVQSIRNLAQTAFYERPFWPNLGYQLVNSLFENYDQSLTEYALTKSITNLIAFQEPRARDVRVSVRVSNSRQEIDASINFLPVNSINRVTVVQPLTRLR